MEQTNVLRKPVITEKSMDAASRGWFTFIVAKEATKREVKHAVEEQFKVDVVSVQTLIGKGKRARVGKRRVAISLAHFKKAIVRLVAGQKIDLFEVPEEGKKQ